MANPNGNIENLNPVRSEEEARILGQKGGFASGEARRNKKPILMLLNGLLMQILKLLKVR